MGNLLESWSYAYDGDGTRVSTLHNSTLTRYYFGGGYETHSDGTIRKYYSFGGTRLMRDAGGLKYFLSDHLGSTLSVLDETGAELSKQRYLPFGEVRTDLSTISQTDFGYREASRSAAEWTPSKGIFRLPA